MKLIEEIEEQRLQERVVLAESDGGTRLALAPMPGFSTFAAFIGLPFGSNHTHFQTPEGDTVQVPAGSAHFLEHKLFEGREEKVFDRFGRLGASFNGGTSFTRTSYYFVTSQHREQALEVLLDFVQDPLITEERVEKEKGIIEQEVRMYEDDPGYRGAFLLLRALYKDHPVRISPGGPVADVRRTTAVDLQACFDSFYRPHQLAVSLAGDFEIDPMLELCAQHLKAAQPGNAVVHLPDEPQLPASERLEEAFAVSRPHLWMGWRDPEGLADPQARLRNQIVSSMVLDLVFSDSSPWHEDLYQRGIIDDSFGAHFSSDTTWGYACVEGLSDDPERWLEGVQECVNRFAEQGPDEAAFQRMRRAAWGGAVSSSQTPASLASAHHGSLLNGLRPFAVLDLLEDIQLSEVAARAAEMFQESRRAVAMLRPE